MLSKSDINFMNKACAAAMMSDFKDVHIGCVAVYQGTVVAIGWNTNKTHPIQKYYNKYRECPGNNHFAPKLHAEMNCINQLKHLDIDYGKVKLYIYRKRNDRNYSLARPCKSCMAAIKDLGIKNIYYTTDDGYGYEKILRSA